MLVLVLSFPSILVNVSTFAALISLLGTYYLFFIGLEHETQNQTITSKNMAMVFFSI